MAARCHNANIDCDGVLDLADKIRDFEDDLKQFKIETPKTILITKFCKALGPEYSQFLFNHFNGRVLAKLDESDTSQVADFNELVFQAEGEERRQKSLGNQGTAFLPTISPSRGRKEPTVLSIDGERCTMEVPWCAHCKKPYHEKEECFILHPEKKPNRDRNRGGKRARTD
ncbi:hypothetical protein CNMCM5793_002937 [Aspergillus hiratsukae]|uniref:Uncharacterized protein n=1 Tax=Aspergillus hiratsukae TaxID=1194566 RepID=A0A8H6P203_9EURO|nr:hypothetical protein CNMCM5793_002937 [Aspergillus hiratsukae]KAF7173988.1 hypothetical protein CNMCM6106_008077 [Aspergillus hiratsukae]